MRFALRGGNFDRTEFLSSMEAIDGIVIDLGLDWEKFENKWKGKVFDGVKMTKKPLCSFPREMNSNREGFQIMSRGAKKETERFQNLF